jgi:hypothetical protein
MATEKNWYTSVGILEFPQKLRTLFRAKMLVTKPSALVLPQDNLFAVPESLKMCQSSLVVESKLL